MVIECDNHAYFNKNLNRFHMSSYDFHSPRTSGTICSRKDSPKKIENLKRSLLREENTKPK